MSDSLPSDELPPWPAKPELSRANFPVTWSDYDRATVTTALARLRVAVDALRTIKNEDFVGTEDAYAVCVEALDLIGPLPGDQS